MPGLAAPPPTSREKVCFFGGLDGCKRPARRLPFALSPSVSLDDLSRSGRELLRLIAGYVTTKTDPGTTGQKVGGGSATGHNAPTFNRRELREAFKWGDTRLRTHLDELVEMEYVVPLSGRLARPISIGWYMNQSRPKAGFWRASSQWNKYGRKRSLLARAARTSRVFWATSQVKMTTSHPQTGTSHPPRRWQPARWKTRF